MRLLDTLNPKAALRRIWIAIPILLLCAQSVGAAAIIKPRVNQNSTYSTIEEYHRQRADLVVAERALRFDAERIRNATSRETKATEIVDVLREQEAVSIWRADPNKELGMPFLWAKETIGGLLHVHMDAMCDASYLLKLALEYSIMHVQTTGSLNSSSPYPIPTFKPLTPQEISQAANNALPTSQDYVPGSWVAVQRARDGFPNELGGQEGFDKWIIGALTINAEEAYEKYNTSAKVRCWETRQDARPNCFDRFGKNLSRPLQLKMYGILRYEPIWRKYVDQLLVSQIEDGISYVELRLSLDSTIPVISEDTTRNLTNSEVMNITISTIEEVSKRMRAQGREKEFVGAIYTTGRGISYDEMVQALDECLALKEEYPDFLVEDAGYPLVYFLEALLNFRAEADRRGLDIPFMFHAHVIKGETLDDGGEVDGNLYDALLLGSKRVGHGFSLVKHPLLMQKYRENGIAVEVCPISNGILVGDFFIGMLAMLNDLAAIYTLGKYASSPNFTQSRRAGGAIVR
ncbi:adenosine deaminase [Rhizoctonia solani AG-1 IA]|uniref:Adenosine deaminase n=1 Tax=Thanatephorus cucumeris (strain AG1-IA) TaxID=983506 RepID=L8WXK8_THACA|nr:adenosine deaminase [Rhizoctonia solani AG-1 IA]